jgi:hypothetical protein
MARPPKPIDWELVEAKVAAGCDGIEIAQDFRIRDNTFYDRFKLEYGESFQDYRCRQQRVGEGNIKFVQYAKALGLTKKGDTQLLTFLGRTRLGQVEAQPAKEKELPPTEELLQLQDRYIQLEHKFNELMNALKPQADPQLHGSHSPLQCVGGSDLEREVPHSDSESNREA